MKLIRKSLSLLTFLFILTVSVNAQRAEKAMNAEKRAERQAQQMAESLDLSTEQTEKVKEINMMYAEKMANIREAAKELPEADRKKNVRDEMKPIKEEQEAELMKLLTPEQSEKFVAMKNERTRKGNKLNQGKSSKGQGAIQMQKKDN